MKPAVDNNSAGFIYIMANPHPAALFYEELNIIQAFSYSRLIK
jgi:hypothetical protein